MADKRAFAQFDVGYLDNPKILDVFDASPIAVCMHIASVLYCAQHLTDGVIAMRTIQRKVGGTTDDAGLLVDAGLWHEPGHDCEGCPEVPEGKVYVHDYLQHNRTSEGVKGKSEAGKKGAAARWEAEKANANRMRTASKPHTESQSGSDETAMAREKEREKETTPKGVVPRKRATRIPDNFEVTTAMRKWAAEKAPNVNGPLATEKFINYWTAKSGKDATKLDWVATWRNWMLSDQEKQGQGQQPRFQSAAERKLEAGKSLVAKYAEQESAQYAIEG